MQAIIFFSIILVYFLLAERAELKARKRRDKRIEGLKADYGCYLLES
jgi:hypothetical protein